VYAPDILIENGLYRMWFGGQGKDGHDRIQLAESPDGRSWHQRGVVLEDPTANHVNDPSVVKRGDKYFMYYTLAATDIRDDIALATSNDGIHWTKQGLVLQPSPSGSWDSLLVGRPSVLVEGDRFRMWYDGRKDLPPGAPAQGVPTSVNSTRAVGYAESRDGLHWTRTMTEPVFGNGAGGVHVVHLHHNYAMLYESWSGTQLATSKDGITWNAKGTWVSTTGMEVDRFGHVTPFLLTDSAVTPIALFVGAACNGSWDHNVIARIELSPAQLVALNQQ
jgi:sucrose-6-phosphate hydrolase SacC (GH32 family)